MKNPGHLQGVGRGADQDNKVVELRPVIRSTARPASLSAIKSSPTSLSNPEALWREFVTLRNRAHESGKLADGIKAGQAFRNFLYAFVEPEEGGGMQ